MREFSLEDLEKVTQGMREENYKLNREFWATVPDVQKYVTLDQWKEQHSHGTIVKKVGSDLAYGVTTRVTAYKCTECGQIAIGEVVRETGAVQDKERRN